MTLEIADFRIAPAPLLPGWRAIAGPVFAATPVVEHFQRVAQV